MVPYVVRRALQSIPLLIVVSIVSFAVVRATPGGPLMAYLDPSQTQEDRQRLEQLLGLDQPLPVQYLKWMNGIVQGDLGRSYFEHRSVVEMVSERLPATVTLMGSALLLGLALGVPLGLCAATRRGSWLDNLIRVLTVAGSAMPHWWLGLILIMVLAGQLKLLPSGGMYSLNLPDPDIVDRLRHLLLPATVLATGWWVTFARFTRSETLEVLGQDFVRTARAKGLSQRVVLLRHVLRNALVPIVTILGGSLASLFSGAALTEAVFSWPGIGTLTLQAAFKRDYPVMMGVLMISSVLIILGNLVADLLYGAVDPRMKQE